MKQDPDELSFLTRWDRVCHWLLVLCGIVIITCVIVQALLQFSFVRQYIIPVEKLEGVPYQQY